MRPPFHTTTGNTYVGPWYKSALELPSPNDKPGEAVLPVLISMLFFRLLLEFTPTGKTLLLFVQPLLLPYRMLFVACFGWQFATRYTLMDAEGRKRALTVLCLSLPLFFAPMWLAAVVLLRPIWAFRAIDGWLTYPDDPAPGLYRSPINSKALRLALTLTLDFPLALLVIFPVTFFVKEDEEPSFGKLFGALRKSPHKHERESVLVGLNVQDNAPKIVHRGKFETHVIIPGASGGGKTTAALSLIHQFSAVYPDKFIAYIDGKAYTNEVFATMLATGRETKWFTLDAGKSTYVFNPLDQVAYQKTPGPFRRDYWTAAFNTNAGNDSADAFFGIAGMANLIGPVRRQPRTIDEMRQLIAFGDPEIVHRREIVLAGAQLQAILECLGDIEPINGPSTFQIHEEMRNGNLLYVALPASVAPMNGRYIGGMFLQTILRAAADMPAGFKGFIFIDEAARFAGRNIELFLQQARGFGLSVIMLYQGSSDTKGQTSNLALSAENNADFHWFMTAWGMEEQQRMIWNSGKTVDAIETYETEVENIAIKVGKHANAKRAPKPMLVPSIAGLKRSWTEIVVDRLTTNELNQISSEPLMSIVQAKDPNYLGALNTVRHFYHTSKAVYERRARMPWPEGNEDTITPSYAPRDPASLPPMPLHRAQKKKRRN